jgi:hypothetical protein
MIDGHNLRGLVTPRMDSSDGPPSGMTKHTHHHSCTNDGHRGSCVTQLSLAQLQEQLSLDHADTRAMLSSQETEHKHEAEVAESVGVDLPMSPAEDFSTMTPMERHKEEQRHGMGPWTTMSPRR